MHHTKHKPIFVALILGLAIGATSISAPTQVFAEEESFAMSISRVSDLLEDIRAGQTIERQFNVINKGNDPFSVEIEAAPYYGDSGTEIDESTRDTHTQISRWISLNITKATLAPGEVLPIIYTITVPADPPSGGQNAVINVTSMPDGSGVGIGKALGYTIHTNIIDGNTRTEATLGIHDIPTFLFAGPISSTIRVDNTGNTDVVAGFNFSVYNYFSEDLVYNYNIEKFISFPKSKVTKNLNWSDTPLMGIFRVDSIVTMLGETYTEQKVVVIIPVFLIVLFILVVSLLIVFLVNRSKARKRKISTPVPSTNA